MNSLTTFLDLSRYSMCCWSNTLYSSHFYHHLRWNNSCTWFFVANLVYNYQSTISSGFSATEQVRRVWDSNAVVADMVCGRYGTDPSQRGCQTQANASVRIFIFASRSTCGRQKYVNISQAIHCTITQCLLLHYANQLNKNAAFTTLIDGNRAFRPFDVSPPGRFAPSLDVSPLGRFAPWTFRPLDVSPPGRFAPWTFRPQDVSPPGRFAH